MLTNNIIKHFAIRVKLMSYAGLTIYGWDNKKAELTPPPNMYLYWNWLVCLTGGFYLCILYIIQIYIKVRNEEELADLKSFATLVLTWGELILVLVISLLATRIYSTQKEIMYLMNQMFKYHTQLTGWLEEKELTLDEDHKKRLKSGEFIVYFAAYFSYIFPWIMFVILFHPLEPIHNILKEWLEFDIGKAGTLQYKHLAIIPSLIMAMHAAANTIVVLAIMVACYYLVSTLAIEDMTPVEATRKKGSRRHDFNTQFYGELEDAEIIVKYRVQQLFNELMNEILASWKVSLHHVACLASCAIMAFFAIKFQNVLEEAGLVAYIVVGGTFFSPIAIQWLEANMLGVLVNISDTFKDRADKLVGRGTLMRVFSRSCTTFYVKEAYPYFTIQKDTFLEFVNEVVDKTITLLLW